jgi:hypothetical protein
LALLVLCSTPVISDDDSCGACVPRQSPIGFKAFMLSIQTLPLVLWTPENLRCHADSNYIVADHVALSNPLLGIGIGGAQQAELWVQQVPIGPVAFFQPHDRFAAAPESIIGIIFQRHREPDRA